MYGQDHSTRKQQHGRPHGRTGRAGLPRRLGRLLFGILVVAMLLGASSPAYAQACSDFGGVLDGFAGDIPPSQLQIDQNCTIRNYPASNPLDTNFAFFTQPGQTQERWLVVFDNVVHTGQMSCNATHEHKIWFTNGSSTRIQQSCQNLLIPVEKIDKQNPAGQTTAAVGVPFTYSLTMPVLFDPATGGVINTAGSVNDLHSIVLTDDLNQTGVDLSYVSHTAYWQGTGAPVPLTFTNTGGLLRFEGFPIILAGDQIIVEITVVLEDTPINSVGTTFANTAKWDFGRLIDGVFYTPLPGEWGISPDLTIAAPALVLSKTGPASLGLTLNLGELGEFTLDIQNAGLSDAWDVTLLDVLPDGPNGGMCNFTPQVLTARVFQADGTTPVPGKAPLVQGTDFSLSYSGTPTCELSLTMLTANASIAPGERLILTYRTQLDANTQDGVSLTNVAGATRWFNGPPVDVNRLSYSRSVTGGTVGTPDHEDAHTVTASLSGYLFEKSVANLTTGVSPTASAAPGDTLRYTLRLQATDVALSNLSFRDDLGALNATAVFDPGSLSIVSIPAGADDINTDPNGGTNGAGLLDVRGIDVPVNSQVQVIFDITLASGIADGTVVTNQAGLLSGVPLTVSDDPNQNGQADPNLPGDEDPTRLVVVIDPPDALLKANTQATAVVGEAFQYQVTVPSVPHTSDIYDVRILDDLVISAADLRFVGVTRISGPGTWTPVNTGTPTNLVIEDIVDGIDIPAGQQITVAITVVLEDTATNVAGLSFTNTASYSYNVSDDDATSQRPGLPGTTAPMTIVDPDQVVLVKTGPLTMTTGTPGAFTIEVENTSAAPVHGLTITDLLAETPTGGTCDLGPAQPTVQLLQANGTPAAPPFSPGSDFSSSFAVAPACRLDVTMLSPATAVAPGQRLRVDYELALNANSQEGVTLTNLAGATEWFSTDGLDPQTAGDRRTYTRVITDGTVSTPDHEDAHSLLVALPAYLFEKTVANLTRSTNPATLAGPGDTLRYTLRVENLRNDPLLDFRIFDELDALNPAPMFAPGTLTNLVAPPSADTSGTSATGGSAGTGVVDVTGLNLPAAGDVVVVQFDIVLASVLPDGSLVTNQSELLLGALPLALSDDPVPNGPADPFVQGDEDPTQLLIESAPLLVVTKVSDDVSGDPALLLAGDTLRYTITVGNIGNDDVLDAILRDAIPVNTQYVTGSTTLNGVPVPDGPSGLAPFVTGLPLSVPSDPTPGSLPADPTGAAANLATLVFQVTVDGGVLDGTIISNQAFVNSLAGGISDQPSDDPDTPLANDPTRDVVGTTPLLFSTKSVVIGIDGGTLGVIDPNDTLHYTIVVFNTGTVPATGATLTDTVPTNTTWVADSLTLNTLPVGQPDGGVSPLIAGIDISSSGLPLPAAGAGTLMPGESAVIEFDVLVDGTAASGTLISNQATVTTNESPALLTDGDGNPATGPEPTVVVVGDGQQLSITKQVTVVGGGAALAGSEIEYVVQVTNIATVPASSVVLTDDLDAPVAGQLTLVAGSATLNGLQAGVSILGSVITADYSALYGPLDPGATVLLRFRAIIGGALPLGTTVTNTGVVAWNTPPQIANASVSFDVGGQPGVAALAGTLWHDADFDAAIGANEQRLVGWTVEFLFNGQPLRSVVSDANGNYQIGSLPPNDVSGDSYGLRFTAPDVASGTASVGTPDSPFTNLPQEIQDILLASGSNLQDLNLPIAPNGVVYDAVLRSPVLGATLRLVDPTTGTALPTACFDDANQQAQITRADGFYKFDVNFSNAACPSGGAYLIAVSVPGSGFIAGVSQTIPPTTSGSTPPLSVPACPQSIEDAVSATAQFCEAQTSEFAPPQSVPPATSGTTYHLHLTLDSSQAPGSSQIFNNHIPLDPDLGSVIAITKTAALANVSRGQQVPYVITFANDLATTFPDLSIVDRFPTGFRYVKGSAHLDGVALEPTINGRELTWLNVGIGASTRRQLVLLLTVGAAVTDGEFVNRAQAFSPTQGALSGEATATVRVVPDPTFDCTDVLGKVFDDANRNGIQEKGEPGLQGVKLVTARGLIATTDRYGRFHITCAVVPNERRGSNFVLKLDDRSLPSGYRLSTRQTQVKRATAGKALRFQYGASIHRVIGLDMADAVFVPGSTDLRAQWRPRLQMLLDALAQSPATLRLSYVADLEPERLVERRLEAVKDEIAEAWEERDDYPLTIETEVFWRRGAPVEMPSAPRPAPAAPPPVSAGPPVEEVRTGKAVERHLPRNEPVTQWSQDPALIERQAGDRLEEREVSRKHIEVVKLTDVVPAIRFESGAAKISPSVIERLRAVLRDMQHLSNVRLHLIGHADDQRLTGALAGRYGDNTGLSRERAGEVAEFLQIALALPPEAISLEWVGATQPVASNATPKGRALNRRVEVEVWYDEVEEETVLEEFVVEQDLKRVKVCRVETVCKLRYREGHAHRARVKNLVPPLQYGEDSVGVATSFVRQIREAMSNLRDKPNLTVKFIGFTNDTPLEGRAARIYGSHLSLSKARARRVSLAVREALDLPSDAVASDGRGAEHPAASNDSARGRSLNNRVEVEFWHDDPLQQLADEPQLCPDAAAAETVTRIYDPPWGRIETLRVQEGQIVTPHGYEAVLQRALTDVSDKANARLRFVGYTGNERLDRRTALAYGDDIGLSAARARRAMRTVRDELGLDSAQTEHEGRGYVHSNDVVNAGFLQDGGSYVTVEVIYDELAVVEDSEGIDVTPITRELEAKDPLALNLMRITVDGEPIDDPGRSSQDIQRCTDAALEQADIRFRFDGLESRARLSVTAEPGSIPVQVVPDHGLVAEPVRFLTWSNYNYFIERQEIRVFDRGQSLQAEPWAIVPVGADGMARWEPEAVRFAGPVRKLQFVLRAYGAEGRFDETAPQQLWMIYADPSDPPLAHTGGPNTSASEAGAPQAASEARPWEYDRLLAGYGETEPALRNIPLKSAGTVRVEGSDVPAGHEVWIAGARVPVDRDGNFAAEAVLPDGLHTVEVAVLDAQGNGELFLRDLELEQSDWFYVGIADLTFAARSKSGPVDSFQGKDSTYDGDSWADGRLAFYVRGKFADDWKLTASADTREAEIKDLFDNFLDKSPGALFRRIDPDYHYPTYGDDGTVEEGAPTGGKLFVKLEKDDSHAMWGSFEVDYLNNELAQVDRSLYGGKLDYQSLATTTQGERRAVLQGFAAEPGTIASREEFRGTGGSLYFLRRQDLLIGSDRVRIEIRDKDSGLVTGVVHLEPNLDYDIDYFQGRILLAEPLAATVDDGLLVRSQGLSGNEAYLVVQYEYSPNFDDPDALTFGGQGELWLTDFAKIGVIASRNNEGDNNNLYGGDLTLRKSTESWMKVQVGRSEGPVSSTQLSNDGGFGFFDPTLLQQRHANANAYRADVSIGARDWLAAGRGRLSLYYQRLESGYSAPGLNALTDTDQYGGVLEIPVLQDLDFIATADQVSEDNGIDTTAAEVNLDWTFEDQWSVRGGVRYERRDDDSPVVAATQEEGDLTDIALQLGYDSQREWRAYGFGQVTIDTTRERDDNKRIGLGGEWRLNEKLSFEGEASHGDTGPAVKIGTSFQESEYTRRYMSYTLENERGDNGLNARRGTLINGIRSRIGDSGSVYREERWQHSDFSNGFTRSLGMTFSPTDHWSFGANWEYGTLIDRRTNAETDRNAGGGSIGYTSEDLKFATGVEYRKDDIEDPDGSDTDRTTWLFRNNLKYQITPSTRLLGKFNHSFSDSSEGDFYDGGYTEGVVGFAYRPVSHDRLNLLGKYTYFYNVPTTEQVILKDTPVEFIQRSHVAAVDASYDVTSWLTVGAKYAYRRGEVSLDREDRKFFDNDAHLAILRTDWRFLRDWEVAAEGRTLYLPDLDEQRSGGVVSLYHYLTDNFKVGVGYNFTDYSDDLTDLDYDDHGWFLNLIGTL